MSLGGGISQALEDAIANSIKAGVVYALAAGNDNQSACLSSPSRMALAIKVGSTTNGDVRSSFSNIGQCVDLFAPGSNIESTWDTSTTSTKIISGTSMATPACRECLPCGWNEIQRRRRRNRRPPYLW